ncbi:MAG: TetR/AcrR family transcriptional regulator [Parasphingorhabdus sp.]
MKRQEAKELNRDRIIRAAGLIIQSEGVEKLTMRRLAQDADVALKTPYNLFESKTGLLISLLNKAMESLIDDLSPEEQETALAGLFDSLDEIQSFFSEDEDYYRAIFWAIMTADRSEATLIGHKQVIQLITARMMRAKEAREIDGNINATSLGNQLGLQLLAMLGIWAAGHITIIETMNQTKANWASVLINAAAENSKIYITECLSAAQVSLGTKDHISEQYD